MIASLKSIKKIGHPFILRNNSILKNTHTMHKLKLFPLSKRIMKMFVTTPSKSKVKQAWYNEYPSTINLKCNEIFTLKNLKILPINAKLNTFQVRWNLLFFFTLLSIWLIPKTLPLKRLKLKNFLLKLTIFQTTSNKIQLCKILLLNLHKFEQWFLIKNPNPNLKNIVLFATKIITLFQPAFVDSICLKNLNHNLDPQLLLFINILKHLPINHNILATVVEVIVTLTVDLLVTPDINLVLTRAHILVLDTVINLTLTNIFPTTTVIDLDKTNIIINPPSNHILLHVHIINLPLLVVHPNIILVLVNAHLVILTPLLNYTTLHTALLLNHVMIATVVGYFQTTKTTLIFYINPLLILLTHLHHLSKVILLQKPNLKVVCTSLLLLHHNIPNSPLNMLSYYAFNLVC